MKRAQWTDNRLDKEMDKIDLNFDRVFAELRAERQAMRSEMATLRDELRSDIGRLYAAQTAFQRQMLTIFGGMVIALIGLLGVWVA